MACLTSQHDRWDPKNFLPAKCSGKGVPSKESILPSNEACFRGYTPLRKQILQLVGIKVRYSPSQLIKFQPIKQPTNPSIKQSINQPTNQSNHFLIAVLSFFGGFEKSPFLSVKGGRRFGHFQFGIKEFAT